MCAVVVVIMICFEIVWIQRRQRRLTCTCSSSFEWILVLTLALKKHYKREVRFEKQLDCIGCSTLLNGKVDEGAELDK